LIFAEFSFKLPLLVLQQYNISFILEIILFLLFRLFCISYELIVFLILTLVITHW
jgi:hypothetical protein